MANTDVPKELKEFSKMFEALAYEHNAHTLFNDMMTYAIGLFSRGTIDIDVFEKKYGDNLYKLFTCLIDVYKNEVDTDDSWYDGLGCFYEAIASKYQRSGFGQFFTPESIVDFMVAINGVTEGEAGSSVLDPACGSARFLIAVQSKKRGLYLAGQDLDRTCCLMSCLDMAIHGAVGEIVWGDTLAMEYKQGWAINQDLNRTGMPSVLPLPIEHSRIAAHNRACIVENEKPEIKIEVPEFPKRDKNQNKNQNVKTQITLF